MSPINMRFLSFLALHLYLIPTAIESFHVTSYQKLVTRAMKETTTSSLLFAASSSDATIDVDYEDEEEVSPGTMRVAEIKSELDLRGVSYADCFDKESLAQRLVHARASGTADPSIIDQFNSQTVRLLETIILNYIASYLIIMLLHEESQEQHILTSNFFFGNFISYQNGNNLELDNDVLEEAIGGDGTLPGGMPPDMLKQLVSNPDLMALMNDPKMQDVMRLMMTGGQEVLEQEMEKDKEVYELVTKLNEIMGKVM